MMYLFQQRTHPSHLRTGRSMFYCLNDSRLSRRTVSHYRLRWLSSSCPRPGPSRSACSPPVCPFVHRVLTGPLSKIETNSGGKYTPCPASTQNAESPLTYNVRFLHSKFLGLHFQPFDSTPTTLSRAEQ